MKGTSPKGRGLLGLDILFKQPILIGKAGSIWFLLSKSSTKISAINNTPFDLLSSACDIGESDAAGQAADTVSFSTADDMLHREDFSGK